ncbi:MAG: stage V sporulation protein AC [Clostridia bacterium]|nr:stage V sporulation protein AC [Clostridia bacterium]
MKMDKNKYSELVKEKSPNSHTFMECIRAFLIGGGICAFGEVLFELYKKFGLDEKQDRTLVSLSIILIASVLTMIGVFDKIAKCAGAGTLVPITGFSNAVTSAAIEFKSEGLILGVGSKMFAIAGPVIVYGVLSSVIYGVIYFIFKAVTGG